MTVVYNKDEEMDDYILQLMTVVYKKDEEMVENIPNDCCL
jgi:hypothetical protein